MFGSAFRPLRVFLCYASQDKPAVRELYRRLLGEGWIDPWIDEEKLLPGQDWNLEIYRAIRDADALIVCLSTESISKEGYVQREFKLALNLAEEKPDGTIYIIPLRLDMCNPPVRFQQWQWVDYFYEGSYEKLLESLRVRSQVLNLKHSESEIVRGFTPTVVSRPSAKEDQDLDIYRFININPEPKSHVLYPFWIAKYPVTNIQYDRFFSATDYDQEEYWRKLLTFDNKCNYLGLAGDEGLRWLSKALKDPYRSTDGKRVQPEYWDDTKFGIINKYNPVVGVSWYEASAYCNWVLKHWNELDEGRVNVYLTPHLIRLPVEYEWIAAAGGNDPKNRYPWDKPGKVTERVEEVARRANVHESGVGHTTPVNAYPEGASIHGVMDMVGNVRERQANFYDENPYMYSEDLRKFVELGGSWGTVWTNAIVLGYRSWTYGSFSHGEDSGFRIVVIAR